MEIDDDRPARPRGWRPDIVDIGRLHTPRWATPRLLRLGVAILVAIILLSGVIFQVQPEEVGVVLRFGRYVRTSEPGLHVKLPFVEQVLQGAGPAPAQGGVRLPHGRAGHPVPVRRGRRSPRSR